MTFRYACKNKKCKHEFDFNHIPRDSKAECPKCSNQDVEKLFSPPVAAIIVNGASAANNYGLKPTRRKR